MFSPPHSAPCSGMLLNMRDLTRRTLLLAPAALAAAAETEPVRMPKKIRVGIIGLEGHTGEIITPLSRLPDVEVVAYWSADKATLRRPENVKRYDDWKAMLDSEKLDVMAVTN